MKFGAEDGMPYFGRRCVNFPKTFFNNGDIVYSVLSLHRDHYQFISAEEAIAYTS